MFVSIAQEAIKLVEGVCGNSSWRGGGTGEAVGRLAHTLPSAVCSLEEQLRQAVINTEATLIFTSLIQLASLSLTYIITVFSAALYNLCSNRITFDLNH